MTRRSEALAAAAGEEIAAWERWANQSAPQSRQEPRGEPLPRIWHVGVTNPAREASVAAEMDLRGIDTFVPMIRFTRYRSRTHVVGEKPLLPRYVLFRREFSCQVLDRIDGLERIVRDGQGMWARVPEMVVHELRVRARGGAFEASPHGTKFMRWLVDQGELPRAAILVPKDPVPKIKRNRISAIAKKRGL